MSFQDWSVRRVERPDIKDFIETHHYSKSINGCIADYCYALFHEEQMKGAMFYGRFAMMNQWMKYGEVKEDVIELRRLCCIDDTPKNTESFFIGASLRLLKKDWGGKVVVSYADNEFGHEGTIYKASNWELVGQTKFDRVIIYEDRRYHDKTIRTKDAHGNLKPFAQRIKTALEEGNAYYHRTKGKNIFTYNLTK
jgi:hypothetical protein|tara:strand:- start:59 stop:643 length:585 start_codon:yes stop_codon:yes gene_type:complete